MKGKKSSSKKASKSVKKSVSKKASITKKSAVKNTSKPIKQSSTKKASAPAKKSSLKKVSAPAKKATLKKISTAAARRPSKSSSTAQKSRSKKALASAKKNQTPDLSGLVNVAFWLNSFQTTMDIYLDLSDENTFKSDLVNEMENCLLQALKLDSNHVPTLILFAAFRLDFEEKLGEAMKALQKADKLSPGNKKVQTLTQRCQQAMNEASDAKKATAKKGSTPAKKRASK